MDLQFTNVRLFACRQGQVAKPLRAGCSAVGLYCKTATWQRILKCSLLVTAVVVLPHVNVERSAVIQWCRRRRCRNPGKIR